jgi:hypothetical protein
MGYVAWGLDRRFLGGKRRKKISCNSKDNKISGFVPAVRGAASEPRQIGEKLLWRLSWGANS